MKKIFILLIVILLAGGILGDTANQIVTGRVLAGAIHVKSPIYGMIYDHRMILIDINITGEENTIWYSKDGDKFLMLCEDCTTYRHLRPFDDGPHEIIIRVVFERGGYVDEIFETINFIVDTRDPKVKGTAPKDGIINGLFKDGFTNGWFEFDFQEANPRLVYLNYGNNGIGYRNAKVNLDNCFYPRRDIQRCPIEVDLSDYHDQEISYWFNITDILDNFAESKIERVDVDTVNPVIDSFIYTIDGTSVDFNFEITESNSYDINYIDYNEDDPHFRRLFSGILERIFKRKRFIPGEHNLTIQVIDEARNVAEIKDIVFNIG